MKNKKILSILAILIFILISCGSPKAEKDKNKVGKDLPTGTDKKGLKETAIQMKEITKDIDLKEYGILVVRFLLEQEDNKLDKLPNFRIRGKKRLLIDNSPTNIQKDAIHIFKVPSGKYNISSLYSINKQGEYEFDKPFPNNMFTVEAGKINYIGDIMVKLVEEVKSKNTFTRKLKLKLPSTNEETILIIKDKLKDFLDKYSLERKIIKFK